MIKKKCINCEKELISNRKKYCSDRCKWWYNNIKKEKEKHLAPFKKRNKNWFYMVVGSQWAKGATQGKRINGTITGGMSDRIQCTVEQLVEVNPENIIKHFKGIPGYYPSYIRYGDQERISKNDILQLHNIVN